MNRFIAIWILLFPAPREVDRYLYGLINKVRVTAEEFPAPREVDRDLYTLRIILTLELLKVSGPSRGR